MSVQRVPPIRLQKNKVFIWIVCVTTFALFICWNNERSDIV